MTIQLSGCHSVSANATECGQWLDWLMGYSQNPPRATTCCWLLAHCDDGVTWGLRSSDTWQLGSSVFEDLCPKISLDNLIELRIFGPEEELLIWRADSAFCGRWLADLEDLSLDASLRPNAEDRILVGKTLIDAQGGFTRVGDGTGREQAVPLMCGADDFGTEHRPRFPLQLSVKHYFTTDSQNGAVRVAASRLVAVHKAIENR